MRRKVGPSVLKARSFTRRMAAVIGPANVAALRIRWTASSLPIKHTAGPSVLVAPLWSIHDHENLSYISFDLLFLRRGCGPDSESEKRRPTETRARSRQQRKAIRSGCRIEQDRRFQRLRSDRFLQSRQRVRASRRN